jgi:uncharacterized membrane protein YqjE
MDKHAAGRSTFRSGLSNLADSLRRLLLNRFELAAIELSQVRAAMIELVVAFSMGLVALFLALAYGSALLVALTWERLGWTILAFLGIVFSVVALIAFQRAKAIIASGKLSLTDTMNELRKDQETLLP